MQSLGIASTVIVVVGITDGYPPFSGWGMRSGEVLYHTIHLWVLV